MYALAALVATQLRTDRTIGLHVATSTCERLFHFAAKHALSGDLTSFPPAAIAGALFWPGDADALILMLVESRLVDRLPDGRLVLHDWAEHCDSYVHAALARTHGYFWSGKKPSTRQLSQKERPAVDAWYAARESAEGRATLARESAEEGAADRGSSSSLSSQELRSFEKKDSAAPAAENETTGPVLPKRKCSKPPDARLVAAAALLRAAIVRRWPSADVSRAGLWPRQLARIQSPKVIDLVEWIAGSELDAFATASTEPPNVPEIRSARAFVEKFEKVIGAHERWRAQRGMPRLAASPPEDRSAIRADLEASVAHLPGPDKLKCLEAQGTGAGRRGTRAEIAEALAGEERARQLAAMNAAPRRNGAARWDAAGSVA